MLTPHAGLCPDRLSEGYDRASHTASFADAFDRLHASRHALETGDPIPRQMAAGWPMACLPAPMGKTGNYSRPKQHQRNTKLVQIVVSARNAHFIAEILPPKHRATRWNGVCRSIP